MRRSEHVSKGLRTASPRCGGVVATRLENLLFPLFFCLSAPSILVSLWRADTLFEAVTVPSDLGREAREFATIPAQQARPTVGLQRN